MRIVSLLPSATEIACFLGLRDQLVGVSHECDWPPSVAGLPRVTGTKIPPTADSRAIDTIVRQFADRRESLYTLDQEAFARLQPDLVLTQTLCDVCAVSSSEVSEAARCLGDVPLVIELSPSTLASTLAGMEQVALAAQLPGNPSQPVAELSRRIEQVRRRSEQVTRRPRVAFLEWLDPFFCAGHWNPELVAIAGGEEVLGRGGERSRVITWQELEAAQPEVLVAACCGYSAKQTLADVRAVGSCPEWYKLPAVRNGRVYVFDGSAYFNRPGPRLVESLEWLAHCLHPSIHPAPTPVSDELCFVEATSTLAASRGRSASTAGF